MSYVTVAKLQNKLEGEANPTTVRKMIDKMIRDGFVESKGSRRLGMHHPKSSECWPYFRGSQYLH